MEVLVTGGTLFVSAAIVRHFQSLGAAVTVLNRGSRSVPRVRQVAIDRNDVDGVRRALSGCHFDLVVDATCYLPEQATTLLAALNGNCARLVMISSASVYANRPDLPPREDAKVGGASVWGDYGRDKARSEAVYLDAAAGFDTMVILRPPYIFGPNNVADRETWFWGRFMNGLPVVLPGDGATQVQFIHEDDLARAVEIVGQKSGGVQTYNVADPSVWTLSELSTKLANAAGWSDTQVCAANHAADFTARTWFPFRDYPCLLDPARLMRETAWFPAQSLEAHFAETYAQRITQDRIPVPSPTDVERLLWQRLGLEQN
jgi:nucleoside-diphosphate-sugar epimerase